MNVQWDFFKKSDTSLGVFYPLHYIIAGYASIENAGTAEAAFRKAGVAAEDVRAVTGDFVARQLETRPDKNVMEKIGAELVKFVGTETGYVKEDKNHAQDGGAFLFIYAPEDDDVSRAKALFVQYAPAYARRYLRIAIEQIVANPNAL